MPNTYTAYLIAALLGMAVMVIAFKAEAQQLRCGSHDKVIKFLGDKYNETKVGMGLLSSGRMMELYISKGGSWTMLLTSPDGTTCFGPVGKHWKRLHPKPAGTES